MPPAPPRRSPGKKTLLGGCPMSVDCVSLNGRSGAIEKRNTQGHLLMDRGCGEANQRRSLGGVYAATSTRNLDAESVLPSASIRVHQRLQFPVQFAPFPGGRRRGEPENWPLIHADGRR